MNLINHIPADRYRHAIICLKGFSEFHKRLNRDDVEIIALNKREGKDFSVYGKLYRVFRQLKPDIVHTRNLTAMEAQVVAAVAGVKARVHGEHGRDIFDLDGKTGNTICCARQFARLSTTSLPSVKIWKTG